MQNVTSVTSASSVATFEAGRRGRDSGFFLKYDGAPAVTVAPEARPDDELVAAMLTDEPWAWKEFQRRFDRLIQRCITKVTRRFSSLLGPDDVRDIYASLYLSLVANGRHKLRSFDPARGNRFSSWIGLLAINAAYDYLRQIKREPNRTTLADAHELACDLPDPFESAVEAERAGIAANLLASFSAKDRTFATLYFGEELDPAEIASRLNISVKTVYSKKHKIQSRLESVLTASGAPGAAGSDEEAAA
jgi:RNA polymerase sigma-70 factor (ECF subfamily)